MRMIAVNMTPINFVEYEDLPLLFSQLDSSYNLPGRSYIMNSMLPKMYQKSMDVINVLLECAESVALTTDCWSSKSQHSYMTVTFHLLTEEFELHSFVLETVEMKESLTAENIEARFDDILKKCHLENKAYFIVTDNAKEN